MTTYSVHTNDGDFVVIAQSVDDAVVQIFGHEFAEQCRDHSFVSEVTCRRSFALTDGDCE